MPLFPHLLYSCKTDEKMEDSITLFCLAKMNLRQVGVMPPTTSNGNLAFAIKFSSSKSVVF